MNFISASYNQYKESIRDILKQFCGYRRQIVYGQIKKDIGEIFRKLCNEKKVEIIEAEACPNHIHMLVSIPPKLSVREYETSFKGSK